MRPSPALLRNQNYKLDLVLFRRRELGSDSEFFVLLGSFTEMFRTQVFWVRISQDDIERRLFTKAAYPGKRPPFNIGRHSDFSCHFSN